MNVVSLSFFRHEASNYESERCGVARGVFFINYLQAIIRAHHLFWKGWELWIHHDDRVKAFPYFRVMESMADLHVLKLIDCGKAKTLCGSMLWRINPLWDPAVEYTVCRDIDSLPMPRDRVMVEEAIDAGATVHAVLDSESHSGPIMGGMSAFHGASILKRLPYYQTWDDFMMRAKFHGIDLNKHGADQRLLNLEIWQSEKDRTLIHQRRQDIQYPEAMETRPVAPRVDAFDQLVHMGGAFDVTKTLPLLDAIDTPELTRIRFCEGLLK